MTTRERALLRASRNKIAASLTALGVLLASLGLLMMTAPTTSADTSTRGDSCEDVHAKGGSDKGGDDKDCDKPDDHETDKPDDHETDKPDDHETDKPDDDETDKPDDDLVVPAQPATTDPCGPNNISFIVPADTNELNWTLLPNGNVTVAPQPGYDFAGEQDLVTFVLPADSGVPCPPTTVVVPAQPATTDPCGPNNISFVVPADTGELDWTLLGNGNLTVAPQPGFAFGGGSQLVTFTLPADSGVLCETAAPVPPTVAGSQTATPLYPTVNPPSCEAAGSLNVPTQPAGVIAQQSGTAPGDVTFTYSPAANYVFPAGTTTSVTVTVLPQLAAGNDDCVEVAGVQEIKGPKPVKKPRAQQQQQQQAAPQVLGTQAAVPTAVAAGLADFPIVANAEDGLLAQALTTGGVALMLAAGWLMLGGRRDVGSRQA